MRRPGRPWDASAVTETLLAAVESYYDAAPRPLTEVEEVGPFTLFVRKDPQGWPFYARPRLGLEAAVTAEDVATVTDRQRELDLPLKIEWVDETAPSLLPAVEAAGLSVTCCPMLVLADPTALAEVCGTPRVRLMSADDPDLGLVIGAIDAGFSGSDEVTAKETEFQRGLLAQGLLVVAGAYDEHGAVVGGGSHGPRGDATELTGIAVVPRARCRGLGAGITAVLAADALRRGLGTVLLSAQDDAVARVYERVGFSRLGTACTAEPV
jgi:GNAT superfamily N-acetyltransferase